jgi:hypothetical protein
MSKRERSKLAKSFADTAESPVSTQVGDYDSLGGRRRVLDLLWAQHKRRNPNAEVILDVPEDPLWNDPNALALSFHVLVRTDGTSDELVQSHYRVIPIKKDQVSERVSALRRNLQYPHSQDGSVQKDHESSSSSVVSLLSPTVNQLDRKVKDMTQRIDEGEEALLKAQGKITVKQQKLTIAWQEMKG